MCDFKFKKNIFKHLNITRFTPLKWYRYLLQKSSYQVLDSKGQAVVEYLLIAFVSITLVLGLATKLIPQVNTYVKNYAGAYVECLLETGELPPPFQRDNSECTIENMQASGRISADRMPSVASSGSTSGSSQGSGNRGSTGQNASGGGGGSNRSSSGPTPVQPNSAGTDNGSSGSSASARGDGSNGKKTPSNSNGTQNQANQDVGSIRNPFPNEKDNGRGISGTLARPKGKGNLPDKDESDKAKIKKDTTIGGEDLRKGSFSAPVPKKDERDPNSLNTDGMGFNFGMYLRYFMIGGLLLALFIMVATQLNSLRKGWGTND